MHVSACSVIREEKKDGNGVSGQAPLPRNAGHNCWGGDVDLTVGRK